MLPQSISEGQFCQQWDGKYRLARFSTLVFMSFHRNIKGFTVSFFVFGDKVW
jgi:hypothetical protein